MKIDGLERLRKFGALCAGLLVLGTGCATYGDFGGSVSIMGASIGGHIGWGTPPSGPTGGGGSAGAGSTGTNQQGGATTGTTTPVTTKPKTGASTTGTAQTEMGAYTADTSASLPDAGGYVSMSVYNVRAGAY